MKCPFLLCIELQIRLSLLPAPFPLTPTLPLPKQINKKICVAWSLRPGCFAVVLGGVMVRDGVADGG